MRRRKSLKRIVSGLLLILLSMGMLVLTFDVQPVGAGGTIYVRADGSIDPPTASIATSDNVTYYFIGNINGSIVVERDLIVLDGDDFTLHGEGGIGIDLAGRNNVTVRNVVIEGFDYGVSLVPEYPDLDPSDNVTILGNRIADTRIAIDASGSFGNKIFGNTVLNNDWGIMLHECSHNVLGNNLVYDNRYNLYVYAGYIHDIDTSNTVDGKQVYYWVNKQNMTVPLDAGYVGLVGCTNITVKGLNLANNHAGVLLASTRNSTIIENNIRKNWDGILCDDTSSDNTISGNYIADNSHMDVWGSGINLLHGSDSNHIYRNTLANNVRGINLYQSNRNRVYHNNFISNTDQISLQPGSKNNTFDSGYPSGGNYWSDYTGLDHYHGPCQDELGSDGIGDEPYPVNENDTDSYPLAVRWETTPYYDWPMFRHDTSHSGYSQSKAPNTNHTVWNYATGSKFIFSSPAVVDGRVYINSLDGRTRAIDATSGEPLWSHTTSIVYYSSPAVAGDMVYVVEGEGTKIFALNATTGVHLWNSTISWNLGSSPTIAKGKIYVSTDNRLYAMNATDGAHVWNYTIDSGNYLSSPAVADGVVYTGSGHRVFALDAENGAHLWNYTTEGSVRFSSPAVADNKVYFGSDDANLYCLNAANGAHIWNYTTSGGVPSSPAVAFGMVYVGSVDRWVYCLNATTGIHIWHYITDGEVQSSPAIADGKVFIGSGDGKVYALNATNGAPIWIYTTGSPITSSAVVADGKVYISSYDGRVYAFGELHDIAITDITLSKTVVCQGCFMFINVTIENQCDYTQTFNLSSCYDLSVINLTTVTNLYARGETTITVMWNITGIAKGNYTISAYAEPVSGETDISDNNFTDSWVIIAMIGDITGSDGWPDGTCDMRDIGMVTILFGVNYQDLRYNSDCDINSDGKIDIKDIARVARHFGEIDP